ncbi:MAG TPA: DeoR/GlpR family DNA-binding transcription regulator [Rhizomicrobium sp.]|nr:DeoR/GlpR family DNA-binding transcription regulator [Rhizomicrobium sp.]
MHERERWRLILEAVTQGRVVTIHDLERILQVSPATVRRDLRRLEANGKLRRVHGGAEAVDSDKKHNLIGQEPFEHARLKNSQEKHAIAKRAAALCDDGASIIIDGGTTTYMMVEYLRDRNLQILTSSFPIAAALIDQGKARVIVPGGEVYRQQQVILSPFHDGIIGSFFATKMFMGAQAITPAGLMQTDPVLVQSEQRLMKRAEQVIALVDSSKFVQTGGLILCPINELDIVITDSNAPKSAIDMLKSAGVEVILVPASQSNAEAA